MEWSLDAIESSLRLAFEEGYNDRYTFTLTDNKLSVDDLHLGVNVCTIEPYGEGYILHPHEGEIGLISAIFQTSNTLGGHSHMKKGIL